jgi:muramoyltetrapeptide carboxypeptidase
MSIIPSYLKPGDTIGITCPAGAVDIEEMQYMIRQLQEWGYLIKIGATVGTHYNKFSGTDKERLNDLQTLLDDDGVKAILFGRGGYGLVRIIDLVDFTKFIKNPKWLLGYSDITCLLSHIHTKYDIATIHAHMCAGYKPENRDSQSTDSINHVLQGIKINYSISTHAMNRLGRCKGILCGGNLALLSDLIGTNSDIETRNKILVIEDIGEYKYNIDRMMWQLLRAGKLENLAGLIVGGFVDTNDNETPFGMTEYEIVWEKVKNFSFPVCFNFPVGHQALNYALKMGAPFELSVTEKEVNLREYSDEAL